VIAAGLTLSILGGLVIVPSILDTKHASALKINGVDPASLDWHAARLDIPADPDCSLKQLSVCTVVHGTGKRMLLLGDSNARMFIPTFEAIAERENLTLSVAVYMLCPWQIGLYFPTGINDCKARKDQWYGGLVDALKPDVIVVADRPIDDPASLVGMQTPQGLFRPGAAGLQPALRAAMVRSLSLLRKDGRKIVMIDPIPIATTAQDPLNCLSSATTLEQCVYKSNTKPTTVENMYASQVKPGAVYTLDLDRVICPRLPNCDPVVRGLIVKRDNDHITAKYAKAIGPDVDAFLHQDGVLQ
jgi:hypothetical protein